MLCEVVGVHMGIFQCKFSNFATSFLISIDFIFPLSFQLYIKATCYIYLSPYGTKLKKKSLTNIQNTTVYNRHIL